MKSKVFLNRLKRLELLGDVNFPEEKGIVNNPIAVESARRFASEMILTVKHEQEVDQVHFFQSRGEGMKLLHIVEYRIIQMMDVLEKNTVNENIANRAKETTITMNPWYVYCPDAYAMTIQNDESEKQYMITLCTPLLGALYLHDPGFENWEHIGNFIDSVMAHEIAHAVGAMKHDKEFKNYRKQICDILEVVEL